MTDIKRSLHWDENEDDRKIKWHEREVKSINRLNDLINNKLNGFLDWALIEISKTMNIYLVSMKREQMLK